jgi:hypothetical protein
VNATTLDPTEATDEHNPYEVPPRIEVRNTLGWITRWRDGDTIRVEPIAGADPLMGRTSAVIRDGAAVFDSLYPTTRRRRLVTDVRFVLGGMDPLELRRRSRHTELRIVSATLNGMLFRDSVPTLRVRAGAPIEGTVTLRYSTTDRGSLYVLARTTTWRAPQGDTLTVRALLAGVADAAFTSRVSLAAPPHAGNYWLLWTQGDEPAARWLLSGTNWECQSPIWGDGNDLAAQPDSVLAISVRSREIMLPYHYCGAEGRRYRPKRLAVVGVRVEVRP